MTWCTEKLESDSREEEEKKKHDAVVNVVDVVVLHANMPFGAFVRFVYVQTYIIHFYTWLKTGELAHIKKADSLKGRSNNIITSLHIIALSRAGHVREWNKENQFGSIFSNKLRLHTYECAREMWQQWIRVWLVKKEVCSLFRILSFRCDLRTALSHTRTHIFLFTFCR